MWSNLRLSVSAAKSRAVPPLPTISERPKRNTVSRNVGGGGVSGRGEVTR